MVNGVHAGGNAFDDARAAMMGYGTTAQSMPFIGIRRRPLFKHITDLVQLLLLNNR
jgi:hypothetical protein